MAKKNPYPHLEVYAIYEQLINEFPEVQLKGAKNPYTALNGNMFSFLDKEGKMSMRFEKTYQEKFIEDYNTTHSIQYGAVMNGYAIIPDEMLNDKVELKKHFEQSLAFVKSLPEKPSKKKK